MHSTPVFALACVAAVVLSPGVRCFQIGAVAGAGRKAHGWLSLRCRKAPMPATLRASANADADAGLSKEEKLRKYQQLAVEMTTKAKKLPPG